jgi:hypothetical protein
MNKRAISVKAAVASVFALSAIVLAGTAAERTRAG